MTEADAVTLAAKREASKGKALQHKRWEAVHDSVRGWHVALVDSGKPVDGIARAMNILSSRSFREQMR